MFSDTFPLFFVFEQFMNMYMVEPRSNIDGDKIVLVKGLCIGCATAPAKFREDNDKDRHWCSKACFDKYNP